jgi:hypothetical protein
MRQSDSHNLSADKELFWSLPRLTAVWFSGLSKLASSSLSRPRRSPGRANFSERADEPI